MQLKLLKRIMLMSTYSYFVAEMQVTVYPNKRMKLVKYVSVKL